MLFMQVCKEASLLLLTDNLILLIILFPSFVLILMGFFMTRCCRVGRGLEVDLGHLKDRTPRVLLLLLLEMHDFCGYYFLYSDRSVRNNFASLT